MYYNSICISVRYMLVFPAYIHNKNFHVHNFLTIGLGRASERFAHWHQNFIMTVNYFFLTIITREGDDLQTYSPIYCIKYSWDNWLNHKHTLYLSYVIICNLWSFKSFTVPRHVTIVTTNVITSQDCVTDFHGRVYLRGVGRHFEKLYENHFGNCYQKQSSQQRLFW